MSTPQVLPMEEKVTEAEFLGVTWAVTWVSFLFMIFRLVVRVKSFSKLQLDDYFVVASWCMLLTAAILWQLKVSVVYGLHAIQTGKAMFTPEFLTEYQNFMPVIAVWNILFYTGLWLIKFSFLIFFRRLGTKVKAHRIWWWVVCGATFVTWVACIADIDWKCSLNDIAWITAECPTPKHILFENRTFYANMAVDVLTDVLIISVPIVILRGVQIPLRKKLILLAIFSASILIMVISIVRVTLVKGVTTQLQSASIDWLYLWSNVEAGVAIIIASVGSFRQLFISSKPKVPPHHVHTDDSQGHPQRSWLYRELFSHFSRLTSRNNSTVGTPGQWGRKSNDQTWKTDSQIAVVPLQSVHVNSSYDVRSTPSATGDQNAYQHNSRAYV